jgi:hypothetical protein
MTISFEIMIIFYHNFTFKYCNVGLDAETGVITETPRAGVQHISGIPLLDNHTVNLLSSFCTAVILPELAQRWWP